MDVETEEKGPRKGRPQASRDEDMFMHSAPKITSVFTATGETLSDDDSDDFDNEDTFDKILVQNTKKRGRGRSPKTQPQPQLQPSPQGNAQTVDVSDDEGFPVMDFEAPTAEDIQTRITRERARMAIRLADTNHDEIYEREMEIAARNRMQKERRLREERQRLESAQTAQKSQGESNVPTLVLKLRHKSMEAMFKIRQTDSVTKVLPRFCEKHGLQAVNMYLEVDGEEVEQGQTANDLELEDGMLVDVLQRRR